MRRLTAGLFYLSTATALASVSLASTADSNIGSQPIELNKEADSLTVLEDVEFNATIEQLVTVAHTNMGMDINLSVIITNQSIDQLHIKGKNYDDTFNTSDLATGVVILNIGGDLVKLQSNNWNSLTGGEINMDFLQDKKAGKWARTRFQAKYNDLQKVALFQSENNQLCEIDYLNFEFAKNGLGLPKGVNSITGTCFKNK